MGYNNREYRERILDFLAETDEKERDEIFAEIQNILYEDLPFITITHQEAIVLYRDEISLSKNFTQNLYYGNSNYVYHLNELSLDNNLTILVENSEFLPYFLSPHTQDAFSNSIFYSNVHDYLPPLAGDVAHGTWIANNLLFQELYSRDINDPSNWIPVIADGEPDWFDNNQGVTIKLKNNVRFTDGQLLTAEDVVESYHSYLNPSYLDLKTTHNYR
ncbi:MAG: ABC transporter substrate-binding protein, partial [Candidatus Kariarchaeaceae archaeon]